MLSRHENQHKKTTKCRYAYRKFGIKQRYNIEDTKGRHYIRVMLRMERRYEGSNILFLESRAHSMSFTDSD